MSSVDERIVAMKFDNSQFDPNAQKSISMLDRLKAALNFGGTAGKGLDDVQASANRFSLSGLEGKVTGVGGKFLAMSTVAITALSTITSSALSAGANVVKAFAFSPVMDGFHEYETKIGSIQTILANTSRAGTKLPEVNKALNDLNHYADKTIYNFGEMTKNIGLFTNAGIGVKDATSMIKGFSNEAAASGTSAEGAAGAAYQLSQALSTGTIRLMDWKSLSNVGMGNKNMQTDLITLADSMGTLKKAGISAKDVGKDFNGSLEKKWLSADVMSKYLKIMAGDMSDTQMKALGLDDAQIKLFKTSQKDAEDAATKVRTFTQLTGTIKEAVGSSWGQTAEILFGNFDDATKLFTDINNKLTDPKKGWISIIGNARNDLLGAWAKMGGRTDVINSLRNITKGIVSIVKPIHDAFREIFPATTAQQLKDITQAFEDFTKKLTVSKSTAKDIKSTFAGLFAIFDIGWQLVKALATMFGELFGNMDGSGLLDFTAGIGDWLVNLDKAIKKGDVFLTFFESIASAMEPVVAALRIAAGAVVAFFKGIGDGHPIAALSEYLGRLSDRLSPLGGLADIVSKAWGGLINVLKKVGNFMAPLIGMITAAFGSLFDAIAESLKTGDFSGITDALNTGLFAVLVLAIKNFLKGGINVELDGGIVKSIKETFGGLTDVLSAMQAQIQSKTLMQIAIAVAILTASIIALSLIDSDKLQKAMVGIAAGFGILLGAMATLSQISTFFGAAKIAVLAGSLVVMSVAILILAGAVKVFSSMSLEDLAKGLGAIAVTLGILIGATKLMGDGKQIMAAGLAMIPLALGLKILASVVQDFADMSIEEIATGLGAMAGALLIIAGAMRLMPADMSGTVALVIAAAAVKILASALADMGGMTWGEIAKAMVVLAGSLILLAAGMAVMVEGLPGAAAMIVAAAALVILAPALAAFGDMSWGQIAKAMTVLAGTMIILAVGLTAMILALPGAAALVVAAGALAVIAPVLVLLGSMSWESILKGLTALAGLFLVLGVSALVLLPVIPVIVLLAASLLILGAGVALIGGGLLLIATAFTIFVAAGTAGLSVIGAMIGLIPLLATNIALGIGAFVTALAGQATVITAALIVLATTVLDGLITLIPKVVQIFNMLIDAGINLVTQKGPALAAAGVGIIITLLSAIESRAALMGVIGAGIVTKLIQGITLRIDGVVQAAVTLATRFMDKLGDQAPKLTQSGVDLIIKLVNGIADGIDARQDAMHDAGKRIGEAIVHGLAAGISGAASGAIGAAIDVAKNAIAAAKRALDSHSPSREFMKLGAFASQGLAIGITNAGKFASRSAANVATSAMDAVREKMQGMRDLVPSMSDVNPTIKPVLDLTDISKKASKISDMLNPGDITPELSYRQAANISAAQKAMLEQMAAAAPAADASGKKVEIDASLHITAPKQLDPIDIYRNQSSQMAMLSSAIQEVTNA
jgi:tape measure domain-containing protein